jgi:hypothetical protein
VVRMEMLSSVAGADGQGTVGLLAAHSYLVCGDIGRFQRRDAANGEHNKESR